MALPWLAALRVIPWSTILSNAPALARSADALLSQTKAQRAGRDEAHALLAERVAALEQRDRTTAELLTQVTAQLTELTTATEVLEVRVRWLLIVAAVALVLATGAAGLVLWLR